MNITIFAITYPLFIYQSPAFVCNNIFLIDSHLKKFSSILFLNQQSLYLKNSKFSNGLGAVIHNEYSSSQQNENYTNHIYYNTIPLDLSTKKSISIINCQFKNIESVNSILIDRDHISIYITNTVFISCRGTHDGVVLLKKARCLTMTHVCTNDCGCQGDSGFLNYDCETQDFSYCLYNTFVNSITVNNDENAFNIFIRSGSQFYRCNNLTGTPQGGFHFSAPECFSFSMATVMKCNGSCFQLSGYNPDQKTIDKSIDMVNFFSNYEYLLKLSGECPYKLTITNSVLMNNNGNAQLFRKNQNFMIYIEIKNCIVLTRYNDDPGVLTFIDCTKYEYDITHLMLLPHFTYDTICLGSDAEKKLSGRDCNAGNCIDINCGKTIGFPENVIPYTTIAHLDLQTATFSPSSKFSKTGIFSESKKFSETDKFSQSNKFSKSKIFLETDKFTQSNKFSESDHFDDSIEKITSLMKLSKSIDFSPSDDFLEVNKGGNQDGSSKGSNKAMIGAIAGVAGAVVIIAIIAAIFIIRKRKRLNLTSDVNMMETQDSGITTNNVLKGVMNEDDPFAEEFLGDDPANGGLVI